MKNKLIRIVPITLFAIIVLVASFTFGRITGLHDGTVSYIIQGEEETTTFFDNTLPSLDKNEIIVYWVDNGEVYHISKECRSLSRSTNIHSGTILESGKSRACHICGNE